MHVLHILEATLGGTRQYLDNIVSVSDRLPGQKTLVYSQRRSDGAFAATLDRLKDAGWNSVAIDMRRELHPLSDIGAVLRVRGLLRRLRPDILHCHSSKAGGVGRLAASLLRSAPAVLYSPHALAANLARRYLLIERILARGTDRFAAISASERDEIVSFGLAAHDRVDVISPVIDLERFESRERDDCRRELGLGPEPLVVGVGRLTAQKDPLAFVRSIEAARNSERRIRAIWVGDGELRGAMEQALAEARLEQAVRITGWQEDVRPYIGAADLLLSTARFESFGYAVAEAMAMRRPVVASRVTGTVDVVLGGPAEMLYPSGDEQAAAGRINRILEDHELARRLGDEGAAVVRREFSPRAMAEKLMQAYSSLAPH